MAKTHRGKALRNLPAHGRATCPIYKATRIKCLYDKTLPDGRNVKVCKRCRKKDLGQRDDYIELVGIATDTRVSV